MNRLVCLIFLIIFAGYAQASEQPFWLAFKNNVDSAAPIKRNLYESLFNPKSAVNKLTNKTRENIRESHVLPKGNYSESCKFCTCVSNDRTNLLSCSQCSDNPHATKNLSFEGICSESQTIEYVNNFLTPSTGFFYEYLQIIELIKKEFKITKSDQPLAITSNSLVATLIEQLEFTRKHLFPHIQALNTTPLFIAKITSPNFKQELKLESTNYLDFNAAKELTKIKFIKDQDFINDETLQSIIEYDLEKLNEFAKFVDDEDTDEENYLDSVLGFVLPVEKDKEIDTRLDANDN